ncbi:MAG: flagellar biosynthesis protein FlhF [Gammaproteobacteria bacterium]|nr:flagellar biosynthesis protein FlhF [Gammaproteobacteria bacterium]
MQIQRFIEPDMRKAMRRVRKTLGPDAVILETNETAGGIEISAAVDYDPAEYERDRAARAATAAAADLRTESTRDWLLEREVDSPATDSATVTVTSMEVTALRDEVQNMRALLEMQVSKLAWDDASRRTPELTRVMRHLTGLGVTPDVVRDLTSDIEPGSSADDSWTTSLRKLVDELPVCDEDIVMDGGIFAVIGPTGAGKTTSIAKLAARYALTKDADDIALVTTDTFRIGARAQLETFGEILGVLVHQANDAESLNETLRNLAHKKLILIDTAGMGAHDLRLTRELAVIGEAEQPIRTLLTLPANLQTGALQDIADTFAVANPAACILTKTDEASALGGVFSVLMRSTLPLAYVANGQRVPDDFHLAQSRQAWLVKAAVELMNKQEFPITEDDLSRLFGSPVFEPQTSPEAAVNEYA